MRIFQILMHTIQGIIYEGTLTVTPSELRIYNELKIELYGELGEVIPLILPELIGI